MNQLVDRIRALGGLRLDEMGRKSTDPADRPQRPARTPDSHLPAGDPVYLLPPAFLAEIRERRYVVPEVSDSVLIAVTEEAERLAF